MLMSVQGQCFVFFMDNLSYSDDFRDPGSDRQPCSEKESQIKSGF